MLRRADGDSVARNAFRLALLTAAPNETPLPVNSTVELDPSDILEVRDMAEAIARAEQIVAAPRSSSPFLRSNSGDLFESLGRRPTDDTAGPASPVPAALLANAAIARPITPAAFVSARKIEDLVLSLPVVSPATEEDAYYHPAGRIRSLADVTLDGYRPEPTLLLRARGRRRSFTWVLGAALIPVVALAAMAILGRFENAAPATSTTTIATATMVVNAPPPAKPASPSIPSIAQAPVRLTPPATPTQAADPHGGVPVFDVNSLPAAGSRDKRRSGR